MPLNAPMMVTKTKLVDGSSTNSKGSFMTRLLVLPDIRINKYTYVCTECYLVPYFVKDLDRKPIFLRKNTSENQ